MPWWCMMIKAAMQRLTVPCLSFLNVLREGKLILEMYFTFIPGFWNGRPGCLKNWEAAH